MNFTEEKAIYLQIAEYIEEKVLRQEWAADERVPSVRDLAASLGVNFNTIIRTYEYLQQKEVIYNKRGLGYFVAPEALAMITKEWRAELISAVLPDVFKKMALLGFSIEEVNNLYQNDFKK